jgi:microcystin-dependent protein
MSMRAFSRIGGFSAFLILVSLIVWAQPGSTPNGALPPGTIISFAGTTVPAGFLPCDGRQVSRSQFPALFAAIGTRFGGTAQPNFALPDLRGRVIVGTGQGDGLSARTLNQSGGEERVTLNVGELPRHSHVQTLDDLSGAAGGSNQADGHGGGRPGAPGVDNGNTRETGSGQAHENMPPFRVLAYIIKT